MRAPSEIFIGHPRAAWVVAILIALCGAICLSRMAVSEYPNVTPVTITVTCSYTGAGVKDLSDSVATILEDQINGVEDIWYYKSTCTMKGLYSCYCTFRPGTPSNIALMNVQNAVKRAEPKLPTEVTQNGIIVKKRPEDRMVMYCFLTDGREMDLMDLSNFVEKQVADAVSRVDGVGQVETSGRMYAMRIWLDPVRLAGLNVRIAELKSAIESQNIQAAAGTVGGEYANRYLSFKLNVKGRLATKEEFENIVVRSDPETGAQILVKDVARVELGCKGYTVRSRFNESPAVYLEVYKSPDANSVETAARVKKEVEKWIARMPAGVKGVLADDSTAFTLVFLKETFKTLLVALVLVVLITYLFLQDWRATFVPAIAIPISLLGTFAFLYPLGYTINVLTMFGLILVIGSLVDDAIVVAENCQALMAREGLSPKAAAVKSMRQITGAIVATTLVTVSCYLPLAFYSGMAGMMYVQFAVTMCIALVLSTTVALVLSPVLCAYMLKPPRSRPSLVFAPFNFALGCSRSVYLFFVRLFVRRGILTLLAVVAAAFALKALSGRVPTTFLPKEDRGYISWYCRLAEGQALERTIEMADALHEIAARTPGVQSMSSLCGLNRMWGSGENLCGGLIRLTHWNERRTPELQIDRVSDSLRAAVTNLYAGEFFFNQPPAIKGLGGSSGVGFNFCSVTGCEPQELLAAADEFLAALRASPLVKSAVHGFTCSTPQLDLKLDRRKAEILGLTPKVIFSTLQNKLASYYVNDFNIKGGVYQVKLQNDPDYRGGVADVESIRIPAPNGESVPLSSIGRLEYVGGTRETMSYNKMLAAWFDVTPAEGVASSEVMRLVEKMQKPKGFDVEWGPVQLQEKENEGRLFWLMTLAMLFAYLFLVAKYESWTIPVSVMLSVVFALVGAYFALWLTDTQASVYAQLGCVMLIGLSAKNAILMVEFSKQERASGKPIAEAAFNGASLRYRAVLMTAWSFVIGVLPLVFARSAGAGAMRSVGICTMGGMLAATLVGIVFVPGLYALFQRMRERISGKP
ncbi:MAG: efflux RND transporter permease subunit [Kiritimatiellae bacterium]|nr:efflux RND transporter permease subunit [Kiritimatiellia bacterium]